MGLSSKFLDCHIAEWEQKLRGHQYPYREGWPSRLFHHSPIENAAKILNSGRLLSRNDSEKVRARDVAAPGVIDHSSRAHQFVRLYFRPRTPTQFHIEGIRKVGECQYGDNTHAPVLVMFVFGARQILSLDSIYFADRNMQTGVTEGATKQYFKNIPFDKVYHEGGIGGDDSIIKHRCAEVLVPSPVSLPGKLQWIYCRSEAERMTLIHSLTRDAEKWKTRIVVSDNLKVFEKRFTFVESVSLTNDGIVFRLNPRHDGKLVDVKLKAWNMRGHLIAQMEKKELLPRPSPTTAWRVSKKIEPGIYRVAIELEGHRAYEANLMFGDIPF